MKRSFRRGTFHEGEKEKSAREPSNGVGKRFRRGRPSADVLQAFFAYFVRGVFRCVFLGPFLARFGDNFGTHFRHFGVLFPTFLRGAFWHRFWSVFNVIVGPPEPQKVLFFFLGKGVVLTKAPFQEQIDFPSAFRCIFGSIFEPLCHHFPAFFPHRFLHRPWEPIWTPKGSKHGSKKRPFSEQSWDLFRDGSRDPSGDRLGPIWGRFWGPFWSSKSMFFCVCFLMKFMMLFGIVFEAFWGRYWSHFGVQRVSESRQCEK